MLVAACSLVAASAPGRASAATALLDKHFGRIGYSYVSPKSTDSVDYVYRGMVIDGRGRIVLVSQRINWRLRPFAPFEWVVRRLHADGTVDRRFGRGGTTVVKVGAPRSVYTRDDGGPSAIAIASGNKIVIAGELIRGKNSDRAGIGIVRVNERGKRDSGFGRNGFVRLRVRRGSDRFINQMTVQPTGRIVFSVYFSRRKEDVLVRLNRDGSRDRRFGVAHGETVTSNAGKSSSSTTYDMAMRPDGGLAIANVVSFAGQDRPLGWRVTDFTPAGRLEPKFRLPRFGEYFRWDQFA